MAKKRAANTPPTDPPDPEHLTARLREYLAWMQTRNYAASTVKRTDRGIGLFIAWCAELDIVRPAQVTRPILERYARYLHHLRKDDGQPLHVESQYNELSGLRCFFRFLARKNYILYSPAQDLELPKLGHRLPRATLTHEEAERVLAQPDVTTDLGVRDRAILETLYSTGIRRSELVRLCLFDLDVGRGTLAVRQGKGKKDRIVPIGERALDWIERYLRDVRPQLVVDASEQTLFVTAYGLPISSDSLSYHVTNYIEAADVGKKGSCHLFRHTMATLMLERGADVRIIQEILGHASLDATQIYTHLSITHLKQVHDETHPSAKRGNGELAGDAAEIAGDTIASAEIAIRETSEEIATSDASTPTHREAAATSDTAPRAESAELDDAAR